MKRAFASLAHPNYRLWFQGQLISLAGTWMQNTAQSYLAFELTKSPAFLGYVAFANGLPTWIFMLYGGSLVDRISKRTILIWTQSIMMILALIIGLLTWFHLIQPWHILVLTALLGAANSFDAPARQSFVSELVPRSDLSNAVALNAAMFNAASTVGPALAGIAYAVYGPVVCFTLNACSFLAVIFALTKMDLPKYTKKLEPESLKKQLHNALQYVNQNRSIQTLILIAAVMSLFGVSYVILIPSWAVTELHGDARVSGYLQAARGAGAVIAAFGIASLSSNVKRGSLMSIGSIILPLSLLFFGVAKILPLSMIAVSILGFSQVLILNVTNALLQTSVAEEYRGRISGIFSLTFFGLLPLGGLLAGVIAEHSSQTAAVIAIAGAFTASILLIRRRDPEIQKIP